MKDLHNHILYGIDDGSTCYDKTIELLKKLENNGITHMVVTPHYIINSKYNCNNQDKGKIIDKIRDKTNIQIYMGNEVYIDNDIIKYIEKGDISTINNTNYLLVEFPLVERLDCAYDILFRLREAGIIPIIAHPERYHYLKVDDLIKLIDLGCLLQGNITSLVGKYGKKAQSNLKLLIKMHMIHLLGTDVHNHLNDEVSISLKCLKRLVDDEMYLDLTSGNFDKVVNNYKISPYPIVRIKGLIKREIK